MKTIHATMILHAAVLFAVGALVLAAVNRDAECNTRATIAINAGDHVDGDAWKQEGQRAERGLGCRDNMSAAHVIQED